MITGGIRLPRERLYENEYAAPFAQEAGCSG